MLVALATMYPRREVPMAGAFQRLLSDAESMDEASSGLPAHYWPIGVAVVMVGCFVAALGDVMVRKAFVGTGEDVSVKKLLLNPTWVVGMLFTAVLDPLSTLVALVFAPASVVTPFAGMHIFWGVVLAKFWLKEEVGILEGMASGLIIIGIVLIVIFAGKQQVYRNLAECIRYAGSPLSIVYIVVSCVLVLITGIFTFDKIVNQLKEGRRQRIQRICLAGCSGLIGGNTNVAAKALSVAMTAAFVDVRIWASFSTYILLCLTAILALAQLFFLNKGLRKFEAIYIVPTTNSFLITSGTIGSIMVLHEYPTDWGIFFFALLLVVAGVTILSYKKSTIWKIITCGGAACKRGGCHTVRTTGHNSGGTCSFVDDAGIADAPYVPEDGSQSSSSSCKGHVQPSATITPPARDEEPADSNSNPCVDSPRVLAVQKSRMLDYVESAGVALPQLPVQ